MSTETPLPDVHEWFCAWSGTSASRMPVELIYFIRDHREPMHSRSTRGGGFTLLELMLALVIAVILLTTVYGALTRTISSQATSASNAPSCSAIGRETMLRMGARSNRPCTPRPATASTFAASAASKPRASSSSP